jgi:hypothetical protein
MSRDDFALGYVAIYCADLGACGSCSPDLIHTHGSNVFGWGSRSFLSPSLFVHIAVALQNLIPNIKQNFTPSLTPLLRTET